MYKSKLVYIAACLGMAFFGVAFIVMGSVLPSITSKYGLDSLQAASLVTFLPVGILLGSLAFGPVADLFGYKILLIISTFITLCGILGLSFFDDLNTLRLSIFMTGLGGGVLNGSTNALVSDISDEKNRSSRLSFLGACYGLGALLIPLLLGTLSRNYPYQIILRGTGFFMLLCLFYFFTVRFPKPKYRQGFPVRQAVGLLKEPLLLSLSFFLFFQSGMEGLFNNWTTSYLESTTSIDESHVILTLTFIVLGMTIARLLLSYLFKFLNQIHVLQAGMLLVLTGIAILHFSVSFAGAAFSLFLIGAGLAAGFPVAIGLIGSVYRQTSGTAIGIALFIALSGNSLLNYAMGFVSKTFDINVFPIYMAVLLILQFLIIVTNKRIIHYKF